MDKVYSNKALERINYLKSAKVFFTYFACFCLGGGVFYAMATYEDNSLSICLYLLFMFSGFASHRISEQIKSILRASEYCYRDREKLISGKIFLIEDGEEGGLTELESGLKSSESFLKYVSEESLINIIMLPYNFLFLLLILIVVIQNIIN